tara:strand:+ start:258 stop:1250 length:993 start_codon:yes stop_codon:yes gene_type:complete
MKAMILAAGFGTRLKPLTNNLPKPLFPILNRPILEHTINFLKSQGIQEIAINLHHKSEKIINYFGDGKKLGVNLHYSKEEKILGTAGGIKKLQKFFKNEPFYVINSDVLTDINLSDVMRFHKEKKSKLTLVVRKVSNPNKYQPILRSDQGRIESFLGHSITNSKNSTQVMFTGIQIIEPDIFSRIPENKFCGTTEDVFPKMIMDGLPVYGYLHQGYWIDIGTRETYIKIQADVLDGRLILKTPPSMKPGEHLIAPPVHIGKDCRITQEAQIGPNAVLGKNCYLHKGAVVKNSILWPGVTVNTGCTIENSVIGMGTVITKNVKDDLLAPEP